MGATLNLSPSWQRLACYLVARWGYAVIFVLQSEDLGSPALDTVRQVASG